MKKYSDIACELVNKKFKRKQQKLNFGCTQTIVKISTKQQMDFYAKPKGEYYCFECQNMCLLAPIVAEYIIERVSVYLKNKIESLTHKNGYKALVVCLGNDNVLCDSLGPKVFDKLLVQASHLSNNTLYALEPNVFVKTNIKSKEHIVSVCKTIKPDICIIIDALSSLSMSRVGCCIQITDSGILAGGAVNRNSKMFLDKKTLGVPTLCIGVPLVVKLENVFTEFLQTLSSEEVEESGIYEKFKNEFVSPNNIDFLIEYTAKLIASSINKSVLGIELNEQKLFIT